MRPRPQPDPLVGLGVIEPEADEGVRRSPSQFANAGEGNVYFEAHVEYLMRVLGIVQQDGSVVLCGEFGLN